MSTGWQIFLLALFVLGGAIIFYMMTLSRSTHRLRLRNPANKSSYIRDHWMKEIVDKDNGSRWWVSAPFGFIKTPAPPNEVIDIGPGGKKYAEAYFISTDEVAWAKDDKYDVGKNGEVKIEGATLVRWIKDGRLLGDQDKAVMANFKAFSTTQREVLVQQLKKAQLKKKQSLLSPEFILPAAAIGAFVIIAISLMIFWGDLMKPILEYQASNERIVQRQEQIMLSQARIAEALGAKTGVAISTTVNPASGTGAIIGNTESPPS